MRTDWTSARAVRLHLTLIALVVAFALLARWQLARALGGNGLSWAYTFEWPLFAIYAAVVWWRILHDDQPPKPPRRQSARQRSTDARAEVERDEYNTYLEALRREDEEKERKPL